MKEFDEIMKLWHVQEPGADITFESVTKGVKSTKRGYAQKLLIQTISVAAVLLAILTIWLFMPFATWTTHFAMLIITCCLGYYLIIQVRDYRKINDSTALLNQPETYIKYLKAYQSYRYRLNTRNYRIYLFCISAAIGLYAIELYFRMPVWVFYTYLLFTIGWIYICYFIFMKNYINRENERLHLMIAHLEKIQRQFSEQ